MGVVEVNFVSMKNILMNGWQEHSVTYVVGPEFFLEV
jgi:hypothetical protein